MSAGVLSASAVARVGWKRSDRGRLASGALGIFAALALVAGASLDARAQPVPGGSLDPNTIPKYVTPLLIPPAMPKTMTLKEGKKELVDYYEIAVRRFQQQVLPVTNTMGAPLGLTTVFGYGAISDSTTFSYPGATIEAKVDQRVRVRWINDLKDPVTGNYLPPLLPIDQTLHWANPPGPRDDFGTDQAPYTGPVPIITHLHGAHTTQESDGFPEAWYLPAANNIPEGYSTTGTYYDLNIETSPLGDLWTTGTAVFEYPNDQRATALWYHDHALGMTRVNVYSGLAGFYLLRGGNTDLSGNKLPGPAPAAGDQPGKSYYEIPLVLQDRSFNADASLFYPDNRAFFEGLTVDQLEIPFTPAPAVGGTPSDVAPIWNPEFFGNTVVVNGRTWPVLQVEPRRYRLRFLDGADSRTFILKLTTGDPTARPAAPALPFWIIGSDGGFLPKPVQTNQLIIAPAERYDVILDFTDQPVGTAFYLVNEGPDFPFQGGVAGVNFPYADPGTSGQVMKFVVSPLASKDKSTPPERLKLPKIKPIGAEGSTRTLSLNELDSSNVFIEVDPETGAVEFNPESTVPFGPVQSRLGTLTFDQFGTPVPTPLMWGAPVTENPALGATEVWEFYNFTADAHPIHVHVVQFQVVNRQPMGGGAVVLPAPWETGFKDTVIALPGWITRVRAKFDIPGLFVWHCHILSHEDNEMMRPYTIGNVQEPGVAK